MIPREQSFRCMCEFRDCGITNIQAKSQQRSRYEVQKASCSWYLLRDRKSVYSSVVTLILATPRAGPTLISSWLTQNACNWFVMLLLLLWFGGFVCGILFSWVVGLFVLFVLGEGGRGTLSYWGGAVMGKLGEEKECHQNVLWKNINTFKMQYKRTYNLSLSF